MKSALPLSFLLSFCLSALAACGSDPPTPPLNTADVPRDLAVPETPDDAPPPDADGPETSQDDVASPDVRPPEDVAVDVAADTRDASALDAPPDASPPDAARDATRDATQDAARDVGIDLAVDARADAAPDARADAATDLGPVISCAECRRTRCQATNDACQRSVFCAERFACLDRCPRNPSPADCRSGCTRAWPATSQSTAFVSCLRAMCPGSCPDYL